MVSMECLQDEEEEDDPQCLIDELQVWLRDEETRRKRRTAQKQTLGSVVCWSTGAMESEMSNEGGGFSFVNK